MAPAPKLSILAAFDLSKVFAPAATAARPAADSAKLDFNAILSLFAANGNATEHKEEDPANAPTLRESGDADDVGIAERCQVSTRIQKPGAQRRVSSSSVASTDITLAGAPLSPELTAAPQQPSGREPQEWVRPAVAHKTTGAPGPTAERKPPQDCADDLSVCPAPVSATAPEETAVPKLAETALRTEPADAAGLPNAPVVSKALVPKLSASVPNTQPTGGARRSTTPRLSEPVRTQLKATASFTPEILARADDDASDTAPSNPIRTAPVRAASEDDGAELSRTGSVEAASRNIDAAAEPLPAKSAPRLSEIAFTARLTPLAVAGTPPGSPTVPDTPSAPDSGGEEVEHCPVVSALETPPATVSGDEYREPANITDLTLPEQDTTHEAEIPPVAAKRPTDDRPEADADHARPQHERLAPTPNTAPPERSMLGTQQMWNAPCVEPQPQQAAAAGENAPAHAADQPKTVYHAQEVGAPATPVHGPVRTLDFQVESNLGRVAMRVADRAGEVKIDVRTTDPSLSGTLRTGLPELTARIEQAGFHAETWHPGSAFTSERKAGDTATARSSNDQPQGDNGQRQDDRRHPAEQQPPAPRRHNRKEFQWLFTSIR